MSFRVVGLSNATVDMAFQIDSFPILPSQHQFAHKRLITAGGMANKRWGRIGDSPIIGAGTYANNETCGVSCTGHGEFFIRYAVAYDISALIEYKKFSLEQAAGYVVNAKLKRAGGSGGVIAVDKNGNIAMPFNTSGMYRAYVKPDERVVQIYESE